MSYQPAYNALFAKPLVNQCIALIQRDQAAAMAVVNSALDPITEFHKGAGLRTAFPWLTLAVESVGFVSGEPGTRESHSKISLTLDVGQFDQELSQDKTQDYGRVLDMIVTTATPVDWETPLPIVHETVPGGVTTPSEPGSVKDVFVESHNYSLVTLQQIEIPVLRVALALQFHLEET
jgi:hypothetical protein